LNGVLSSDKSPKRAGGCRLYERAVAQAVKDKLGATVQIAKRSELHTFIVMPKQWIFERSFTYSRKTADSGKSASEKSTPAYPFSLLGFALM
jgi:hypothetical protein